MKFFIIISICFFSYNSWAVDVLTSKKLIKQLSERSPFSYVNSIGFSFKNNKPTVEVAYLNARSTKSFMNRIKPFFKKNKLAIDTACFEQPLIVKTSIAAENSSDNKRLYESVELYCLYKNKNAFSLMASDEYFNVWVEIEKNAKKEKKMVTRHFYTISGVDPNYPMANRGDNIPRVRVFKTNTKVSPPLTSSFFADTKDIATQLVKRKGNVTEVAHRAFRLSEPYPVFLGIGGLVLLSQYCSQVSGQNTPLEKGLLNFNFLSRNIPLKCLSSQKSVALSIKDKGFLNINFIENSNRLEIDSIIPDTDFIMHILKR